ncbi:MAG TPA: FISUMP domain-containing protein [Chryseolinea sp.]
MKPIHLLLLISVVISSCQNDETAELPENASVKVLSIDLPTRTVSLIATQPTEGIEGTWSVVSQNQDLGSFSSLSDPLGNFTGSAVEHYVLRWTLSNGPSQISSDVEFTIAEGHSIAELSNANVSLKELVSYVPLKDLVYYGFSAANLLEAGATIPNLIAAGTTTKELLDLKISPYVLLQGGAPIKDILNYDRGNIKVLMEAGVTIEQLSDGGALVKEFRGFGVSDAQLQTAGLIGTMTDIEGNVYPWVKIGKQRWMAENLRTTTYADGTAIPSSAVGDSYQSLFGKMYTILGAANGDVSGANPSGVRGACPSGWHLPSAAEYSELQAALVGGVYSVSVKLRSDAEEPGDLWQENSRTGNNLSGFNATPGAVGIRNNSNVLEYTEVFMHADFWTSDPQAKYGDQSYEPTILLIYRDEAYSTGMWGSTAAVRCAKD